MKKAVFWVVAPRSLVEDYRRFRGDCCLHHQGDEYSDYRLPDYTVQQPRRQPSSRLFLLLVSSLVSWEIYSSGYKLVSSSYELRYEDLLEGHD
jgi:hypothetical protein